MRSSEPKTHSIYVPFSTKSTHLFKKNELLKDVSFPSFGNFLPGFRKPDAPVRPPASRSPSPRCIAGLPAGVRRRDERALSASASKSQTVSQSVSMSKAERTDARLVCENVKVNPVHVKAQRARRNGDRVKVGPLEGVLRTFRRK